MSKEALPVPIDPSPSLDLFKIVRESLKLPLENGKLAVSISLLVVFPFSILVLIHNHAAGPLLSKLEDQELSLNLSGVGKDIGVFLGLEAVYFLTFSIISLFGIILTIYASAATYTNRFVNLNDLFSKTRVMWKKTLVTWICIWIFIFSYTLAVFSVAVFGLFTKIGSVSTWLYPILGCLAAMFYLYLTVIWTLSLVITVLEQGCYGMKAIERAREVIRGNEVQGLVLMLFFVLLTGPVSILFYLNGFNDELGFMGRVVLGFFVTGPFCIGKLFTYVGYTVFYYECKKRNGSERVDDEVELGNGHGLVPSDLYVHD